MKFTGDKKDPKSDILSFRPHVGNKNDEMFCAFFVYITLRSLEVLWRTNGVNPTIFLLKITDKLYIGIFLSLYQVTDI